MAKARICPEQYALNGGRPRACERLLELTQDSRYKWVVVADIRNQFGSFDIDAVARLLPFPRVFTHRVLDLRTCQPHRNLTGAPQRRLVRIAASQGISQGSAASSVVAEMLLADVTIAVPHGTAMVMYVDNLFVFAATRAEAEASITALQQASASPSRLFCLRTVRGKADC